MKKPIIITGFPYAFPYYFKVFEYLENKDNFVFVLPKVWSIKKGKVKFKLEPKPGFLTYGLSVDSYGGHGIRGLFKGWLPGLIFLLPYLRIKYGARVLYSCSEPHLLTTLYNGIIAKFCGFKHVLFTWQNVAPQKYMSGLKLRIYTTLVRLNLWLADGIICGNKKAARIITNYPRRSRFATLRGKQLPITNKILICPISGVDTDRFRPGIVSNWRQKLSFAPDQKLILFYGALDKRKGLNILIEAIKMLIFNFQFSIFKLVIVGTGPEQNNLKFKIENLKLTDKVIFLDWMPNDQLPALLNSADVFVYPSVPSGGWEEQFGYAMAEANACGVPVVASRTGSIDEIVDDNNSGLLVEPNNPEQLAKAIARLLSDDNLCQQMGEFGRKYVISNFSHKVIASKIENFLLDFLGK